MQVYGKDLFGKDTRMGRFVGLLLETEQGELGRIKSAFGTGTCRVVCVLDALHSACHLKSSAVVARACCAAGRTDPGTKASLLAASRAIARMFFEVGMMCLCCVDL